MSKNKENSHPVDINIDRSPCLGRQVSFLNMVRKAGSDKDF